METKNNYKQKTPLRIAINTRLLIDNKLEGIGVFTLEIFLRMAKQQPEIEFFFIFDRPFSARFTQNKNVTGIVLPPPTRHPVLWYYWFGFAIPRLLRKIKADLFISPDGMIPLKCATPSISVIHDLNFVNHPENVSYWAGKFYNHFYPKYAKAARHVVTVSEYSKQDIVDKYGTEPGKISVIYNAASSKFVPITKAEQLAVKEKYSKASPYFIYVGAFNPRKNLIGLLKAFEYFKETDHAHHKLVLVGAPMFKNKLVLQYFSKMRFRESVVFTGRTSFTELNRLVASARALVLVSYNEGFGIPLVEAMQCKVPIICSNRTALPEVAGKAAILVNPGSTHEIAKAMTRMASEPETHKLLANNTQSEIRRFSWSESAQKMMAVALKCTTHNTHESEKGNTNAHI